MFIDLFIIPQNGIINEAKASRILHSSKPIVKQFWHARNWRQINETVKTAMYYGIVYDNEWFDQRLVKDLHSVLLMNLNIDMFSVFRTNGEGNVRYEPRIFTSSLLLDPDIIYQPLPFGHTKLRFEKLIGGWLYYD